MKKSNIPPKDPVLKNILGQYDTPEIPSGFSSKVMTSVISLSKEKKNQDIIIPMGIKLGIPAFLLVCALLMLIFPGDQQDPINSFLNSFSFSAVPNFFDRISEALQSYKLPEVRMSNKTMFYILGGIGLIWMFLLSEGITRRFNKSKTPTI